MKKWIVCLFVLLMTASLVPAVSAAEMPILYTPVKPVHDGVITAEEWGEPDAVVNNSDPTRPEKIEYWWRYTETNLYFAVRVHTKNFKNGTHDEGGSYLIPRIQLKKDGSVTYTGLISMTKDNELFTAHLSTIANRPCGARVVGDTFEMEFGFPIHVFGRDEVDYLNIQLDYHEPKEITNSLPVTLIFSPEEAELPAPAETEPPETEAPENDPPETNPAETDPPLTEHAASVSPVVIGAVAAAVIVLAVVILALRKKKK